MALTAILSFGRAPKKAAGGRGLGAAHEGLQEEEVRSGRLREEGAEVHVLGGRPTPHLRGDHRRSIVAVGRLARGARPRTAPFHTPHAGPHARHLRSCKKIRPLRHARKTIAPSANRASPSPQFKSFNHGVLRNGDSGLPRDLRDPLLLHRRPDAPGHVLGHQDGGLRLPQPRPVRPLVRGQRRHDLHAGGRRVHDAERRAHLLQGLEAGHHRRARLPDRGDGEAHRRRRPHPAAAGDGAHGAHDGRAVRRAGRVGQARLRRVHAPQRRRLHLRPDAGAQGHVADDRRQRDGDLRGHALRRGDRGCTARSTRSSRASRASSSRSRSRSRCSSRSWATTPLSTRSARRGR